MSPKRTPARKPARNAPKKGNAKGKKARKPTLKQNLALFRSDVTDDIAEVHVLADSDCVAHVRRWLSTGCLELDRVLTPPALLKDGRIGGMPCGRVVEIYGPAHIGKSTLLDHIFVSVQRDGGAAILLETDAGRDEYYTGRIGVDTKNLQYFQFSEDEASIENVADKAIDTIKWWKQHDPDRPIVIGFDALGVTPTNEEIQKSVAKSSTASAARVLRRTCRNLAPVIAGTNITFIVLNHEYKVPNFGGGVTRSNTYGGDALALLATIRIKLHRVMGGQLKEGSTGVILGNKVGYEVVKFKLGGAYRKGEFALLSGKGIDNTWTLWDTLGKAGIIQISGSWGATNINGSIEKFQGWGGLRRKCSEDPDFLNKLVDVYHQYVRGTV